MVVMGTDEYLITLDTTTDFQNIMEEIIKSEGGRIEYDPLFMYKMGDITGIRIKAYFRNKDKQQFCKFLILQKQKEIEKLNGLL